MASPVAHTTTGQINIIIIFIISIIIIVFAVDVAIRISIPPAMNIPLGILSITIALQSQSTLFDDVPIEIYK